MTPLLDFVRAVGMRVWDSYKSILIALLIAVLMTAFIVSLAQLFTAIIPPECHAPATWHHVTVPITVSGTPGTEEKWVCQ